MNNIFPGCHLKACWHDKKERGFTLFEILIALFIFSLLSLMLAQGLRSVLNNEDRSKKNAAEFYSLQFTMAFFMQDLTQLINRPILTKSGGLEPALLGSPHTMRFSRAGIINPVAQTPQSSIQRVMYFIDNHNLYRRTWPVLDQAPRTQPQDRILLTQVKQINFQYYDQAGHKINDWPLKEQSAKTPARVFPHAIQLSLSLMSGEKIITTYAVNNDEIPATN